MNPSAPGPCFGSRPADFVVEELPAYAASGEGGAPVRHLPQARARHPARGAAPSARRSASPRSGRGPA